MNPLYSLLLILCLAAPAWAQEHEDHAPKDEDAPLIRYTSAAAVRFQLKQLTNKQLTKVERASDDAKYIPVYTALLTRPGLESKLRKEAVQALVKLNKSDPPAVLIEAIKLVDDDTDEESNAPRSATLLDLGAMLLREKKEALAARRDDLAGLADANNAPSRQVGYAGLIVADGAIEKALELAALKDKGLRHLLAAAPLIKDKALLGALYPVALKAIKESDDDETRAAAGDAIAVVPGKEAEAFVTLAGLLAEGNGRAAAAASMRRIPASRWPADGLLPAATSVVKLLEETPAEERTGPAAIEAVQLGYELAAKLPAEAAAPIKKALGSLGVRVVVLVAPPEQMLYSQRWFAAEAGKPVQVNFQNTDTMPHNFVLLKPGALEEIGTAAESMQPSTDPAVKQFVPVSTKVLASMQLVQPNQAGRVSFTAPAEPGEYPYVCTYPGHWRRMYGVMVVVKDLDAFEKSPKEPADPLGSTRSLVKPWTVDDLKTKLATLDKAADAGRGKAIFAEAGCVLCHKMKGQGGAVGPELSEVFTKWKGSREDVLREILEPSKVIDDKFRPTIIETNDGDRVFGLVTEETADAVMIVTNPQKPLPQKLLKSDIAERSKGQTSMMPQGLLNVFKEGEVLDLLRFLETGGESKDHKH